MIIEVIVVNDDEQEKLREQYMSVEEFKEAVPEIVKLATGLEETLLSCPECGEQYAPGEDDRVDAGLKCGKCAYGYGERPVDNEDLEE
ncbi:MAG TPA: hypothetical protein VN922_16420 [Bacteroidia bacterium]|nr:hypothetical protein [Bacteroidia bacterium]